MNQLQVVELLNKWYHNTKYTFFSLLSLYVLNPDRYFNSSALLSLLKMYDPVDKTAELKEVLIYLHNLYLAEKISDNLNSFEVRKIEEHYELFFNICKEEEKGELPIEKILLYHVTKNLCD